MPLLPQRRVGLRSTSKQTQFERNGSKGKSRSGILLPRHSPHLSPAVFATSRSGSSSSREGYPESCEVEVGGRPTSGMAGNPSSASNGLRTEFIIPYYQTLTRDPHQAIRFYTEDSKVVYVGGGTERQLATTIAEIQALHTSLHIVSIELLGVCTVRSTSGAVMIKSSGILDLKQFSCTRGFTQIFFLKSHGSSYIVLVDILFLHKEHPATHLATTGTLELEIQNLQSLLESATEILKAAQNDGSVPTVLLDGISEFQKLICDFDGIQPSYGQDQEQSMNENYNSLFYIPNGQFPTFPSTGNMPAEGPYSGELVASEISNVRLEDISDAENEGSGGALAATAVDKDEDQTRELALC